MQQDLKNFVAQWLRVALMALLPVVFTAFVTIPWNLQDASAAQVARGASGERHMT
jgi:hypothetical protein